MEAVEEIEFTADDPIGLCAAQRLSRVRLGSEVLRGVEVGFVATFGRQMQI